jgi:electron transfer flavoprotein beta subunit
MKILVAVKRVVDYNVKVRVKADQTGVELNNIKMSMNPFDEIAVEEGVRLRETGIASELIAISIGTSACQDVLRSAMALGADRGILVETDQFLEPLAVAHVFKSIAEHEKPDLIILGKQAIDDDCNQTGQMLAGLLGWPQGTFISELTLENEYAFVTREVDGGLEKLRLKLPAVITTDLRLNTPRYPKLPNIMKAKQKPLATFKVIDLSLSIVPRHQILKVSEPSKRTAGIKVKDVQELVERLTQEAKVI